MDNLFTGDQWLAYAFVFLMGLSMLIYAILDGYDLGVGILTAKVSDDKQKDMMIASIGPFWDANETWLILGVGLLLVAFPVAHGIILGALYLPVAFMLFGLIFRGVAFDFRVKAPSSQKSKWDKAFFAGSFITAMSQGYMLGSYIIGFDQSFQGIIFSFFIGLCVVAGYCLIGACWLIFKTTDDLQIKSVKWAKLSLIWVAIGLVVISLTTPLLSERIFDKWFSFPFVLALLPIPIITAILVVSLYIVLKNMPFKNDRLAYLPFIVTVGIFVASFAGLAYSFFPYIVPDQLLITKAAASLEALWIMLIGALIVLPILLGYTALSYYIFHGKAESLTYD